MQHTKKKKEEKNHEVSTIRNGINTPTLVRGVSTQKLHCTSAAPSALPVPLTLMTRHCKAKQVLSFELQYNKVMCIHYIHRKKYFLILRKRKANNTHSSV